ncbi:MAG: pyridoxal phosphate-dependent aminotransferase [Candidatus Thorarchaeota archaeon]|nr:pyridoxal phosphate-dependent aminotransferase [Candidatus Thorarchaeota archaeon]
MDWTSHHMEVIPASGTLKMLEIATKMEKEGKKIYHFEVGQPDFSTPQNIIDTAIKALNEGKTRYASSRGVPELLDAIEYMYAQRGIKIDGNKNVIVTPGAKMALFNGFLSTIDAGDDVLLLNPAWPTYKTLIRHSGALPVDVTTNPGYELNEEALKDRMGKEVAGIVINSPNNPTGGVLTKDHLKFIYDLACDHNFLIFSDEIYESLVYDGFKQTSMLEVDPDLKRSICVSGFSKSYAMTGWRLGYAIAAPSTIKNMVRVQQNTTSCATTFVQYAGVEAIRGDQSSIDKMRNAYQDRRDLIQKLFCEIIRVECLNPMGAFYVFPDFSEYELSSATLAELLLKKTGVVTAPGHIFGEAYDNHLRFSYAASTQDIMDGIEVMAKFLQTLK